MKRKTTHMKLKGAALALALALLAPAAAHGASTRYDGPEYAVRTPASPGGNTVVTVRSSGQATFRRVQDTGGRAVEQQAAAATRQGGLGWREAAIGAGTLLGILLFGLWGDVAVGAVIFGVAILLGAGATLVTRKPRDGRAWSASCRQPRRSDGRWGASWLAPGQERR